MPGGRAGGSGGAYVNVNLVADVGNTRIKWGVCAQMEGEPTVIRRANLGDDQAEWAATMGRWQEEFPLWQMAVSMSWAVAGVHPERCQRLRDWLIERGDSVVMLDRF